MKSESTYVIGKRQDFLNLLMVVALAFFGLLQVTGLFAPVDMLSKRQTALIRSLVFMNALHITFTYVAIALIPELREWSRQISNGFARKFWSKTALSILGITLFLFLGSYRVQVDT